MKLGVVCPLTDSGIDVVTLAVALEERGIESLFLPEHTHVPVAWTVDNPAFPPPTTPHFRLVDPFVALSAAAAVTERLALGTGVCLVPQHEPLALAKAVATLDRLSGGRVLLGVGAGWNAAELANHGVAYEARSEVLRERVLAMRALWADEQAEFHGRYVDFDAVYQWPKPLQQRVPVLVGGNSRAAVERAVAYGDGWMPQCATGRASDIAAGVEALRAMAAERGRVVGVTAFGAAADPEALEELEALGVERAVLVVPPGSADEVLPVLDRVGELQAAAPNSAEVTPPGGS